MLRPNELRTHQTQLLQQWYADPLSCLHTTLATVLIARHADPLQVLGRELGFAYLAGHITGEEFYYPSTSPNGIFADLAPFHQVSSFWWRPSGNDLIGELHEALKADGLLIAAVDNFHLPHRPAFHDVHAAHLVVIDGLDEGRQTLSISDAQPPAWRGHVELDPFLAAWGSSNPDDDQDAFFSDAEIEYRCLRLTIDDALAPMTYDDLVETIRANLGGLTKPLPRGADGASTGEKAWNGIEGLARYLEQLADQAGGGDSGSLSDLYTLAWPFQAQAYLHGELLRWASSEWSDHRLAEIARCAHAIASAWTNLRVLGAHLVETPAEDNMLLRRRAIELRRTYEDVAYRYDRWLGKTESLR